MIQDWRDPIHPGEILAEEMAEIDINASQLAQYLGVAKNRIYQIVEGKRSISSSRFYADCHSERQFAKNLSLGHPDSSAILLPQNDKS